MTQRYLIACNECEHYYNKCPWCGEARPPNPRASRKPAPKPTHVTVAEEEDARYAHELARLLLSTARRGPL